MRGPDPSHPHRGKDRVVLVSDHVDGRSRSAVAAVRALGAAGYRPIVTVSGGRSAAAASRSCSGVLHTPRPGSPGYREAVERYVDAQGGVAVLAASDAVLVELEQPGADLVDKARLPDRAAAAGLRVPATREFADRADLLDVANDLEYPIVVKATVKTLPSEVAHRVDSAHELPTALADLYGPVVVQPFAVGTMRAVCGVIRDGRLLAAVHQEYVRIWPPGCGTASAAVTTDPDLELEARLPRLLNGHDGVFQVQLIGDQVIDVNPRVYGSLPLAVAAGANLPAIACGSETAPSTGGVVRARAGVRYRWLEGDLRRLLNDAREGTLSLRAVGRALLPHVGTAHSVESLRDPGPLMVRVVDAARRRLP
jgi:predicted ATP-grasp superfamily ATP-dependent carboligase